MQQKYTEQNATKVEFEVAFTREVHVFNNED